MLLNLSSLQNLKFEWRCNDESILSSFPISTNLISLDWCTLKSQTGVRIPFGVTSNAMATSFNQSHGIAERLVSLSLGGGIGEGVSDAALVITLSLSTNLQCLKLVSCPRVTDQCVSRFGEGRGLVGVFVSSSFNSTPTTTNSIVARMDALPLSIIHRLRGVGIKGRNGIHHGETYQYLLPTSESQTPSTAGVPPPPRLITTVIDGVCANCPPSSSFEA